MKLLLDTHIWLWSALEPQRLARRVKESLTDPTNELWLSPLSVGELIVLLRKGRLQLPRNVAEWVATTIADLQIVEAPLTVEVALAVMSFDFPHGDPADHFIASSAKVFNLTLVTADENLTGLRGIQVMANR